MILDRSLVKKPLMPLEETRIRVEMFRIKERIDWIKTKSHDSDLPGKANQNVVNTLSYTT